MWRTVLGSFRSDRSQSIFIWSSGITVLTMQYDLFGTLWRHQLQDLPPFNTTKTVASVYNWTDSGYIRFNYHKSLFRLDNGPLVLSQFQYRPPVHSSLLPWFYVLCNYDSYHAVGRAQPCRGWMGLGPLCSGCRQTLPPVQQPVPALFPS